MITYFNSPTNNDQWIVDLFKGRTGGFFIEAGALDGIHGSCTWTLEKHFAWKGILAEPGAPYSALTQNRPGSICEQVCLSDQDGSTLFVECLENGYSGIKEKLIAEDVKSRERWGKPKDQWLSAGFKEKTITTTTLASLLRKHHAPSQIDYLALDVEGAEYDVLKDFPFTEYTILALSIEGDSCNALLTGKGFVPVKNPFNTEAPWEYYFLHPSLARTVQAP